MGEQTLLGYVILAAREAHLNVSTEEKLVEAMQKVMQDKLPSDALDVYLEWIGFDEELRLLDAKEEYNAELEQAAGREVA